MSRQRERSAVAQVPRITLTPGEAAEALGCSRTFFDEWVGDELHWVRRGRMKFVLVSELQRWARDNAARTLQSEKHR